MFGCLVGWLVFHGISTIESYSIQNLLHTHTHTHTHTHIYIYIYIYMCVCVCVCTYIHIYIYIYIYYDGAFAEMDMDMSTRVQIQNEAVWISQSTGRIRKSMNPHIFLSTMSKYSCTWALQPCYCNRYR